MDTFYLDAPHFSSINGHAGSFSFMTITAQGVVGPVFLHYYGVTLVRVAFADGQ